ncbi:hypothetical protein LSH36_3g19120 [Paralvinella palmiformis]|uniref:BTB domain-containing protein n=1 Tax=Paralvinella palmiformis TaxID=53620 RepID=A0AAD9KFX1_9ANNE|nr:hypothetical protein LSH36_3g19120 [Paralvinella palmiformis]
MTESMALDRYRATVWPVLQVEEQVQFSCDNNLTSGLVQMRCSRELCDVTLHLQGHEFPAHKVVLAATSEYFRMMFTSNMKEKNSDHIDLTESVVLENVSVFDEVLFFLYTGHVQISLCHVEDFIRAADFLLLTKLKDFCQEFYLRYLNLNLNNCLRVSAIADRHHLQQVSVVARNMLCSRFHDHIAFSDEFLELPEPMFLDVLKDAMLIKFMSSDDLVQCIRCWVQHEESRLHLLTRLLHCIDLNTISLETTEKLLLVPELADDGLILTRLQQIYKKMKRLLASKTASPPTLRPRRYKSYLSSKAEASRGVEYACAVSSDNAKSENILLCINTNPFLKYIKILLYQISKQKWYTLQNSVDSLIQNIPGTQTVGAAALEGHKLYLFVSYFIPFPQNLQTPMVLEYDILSGERQQLVFHHSSCPDAGCETVLIDLKSLPPVFLYRNNFLYLVANVNSQGYLYVCDITKKAFECFQIPGTRFISKARAVFKNDRQLYIWCRHRFGSEDVHFHPKVSFLVFDAVDERFGTDEFPPPTGISYYDFENPHILCVQDSVVVVHTPGKRSYRLDEAKHRWIPEPLSLPGFPRHRETPEMGYHGNVLYVNCNNTTYLLQNPAIFTTSLCSLKPGQSVASCLRPPPLDGISVVTASVVSEDIFLCLQECTRFDQSFTEAIMNPENHPACDSDDSGGDISEHSSDEQDGFLFDDEIYGFNE